MSEKSKIRKEIKCECQKRDVDMIKKSITILGGPVDYVYIIRDVDVDEINLEKYSVKCVNNIEDAWGGTSTNPDEKVIEVVLQEKMSNIKLSARASVIEVAAKNGGKIIKDHVIERAKRGKKVYISELIFFKELAQ